MAETAPRSLPNPLNEPRARSNRREREFLRYAEVVFGLPGWESSEKARSSGDVSLTAFAQLVSLRLNAKRTLICLYDKSNHYILAEATRTLSLQQDAVHEEGDGLFWGTAIIPLRNGMNAQALNVPDGQALEYTDLVRHERHSSHPHVASAPYLRSFAGVPMLSPSGFPIGTLSILDDKPRARLNQGEITFMHDVAASIISHLELSRTKAVYQRGIKMVKGLSRFMEGKFPKERSKRAPDSSILSSKRKRADVAELSDNEGTSNMVSNTELTDWSGRSIRDQRRRSIPYSRTLNGTCSKGKHEAESTHIEDFATGVVSQTPQPVEELPVTNKPIVLTTKANDDIVAKDIAQAFERAASIIQEGMDMAGVLFLHASAALGGLRPPTGNSPKRADGSDGGTSTNGGSDDALSVDEGARQRKAVAMKMCRPLAAAYRPKEGEEARISNLSVSERFLKSLMQRFPFGRIWNFSDDELLSSDEHSDSSVGGHSRSSSNPTAPPTPGKRRRLYTDHERILELFPGVRSFGIMPMWDTRAKRFYAGAIIWSYNTSRIFSMADEINYLGAFCDVIMAEVGRLDVQADMQAKTTFISSISHELRSPLHGILGGVECLQEVVDLSTGAQMLQMIDTCGRSLLDIINNLLDHAQVSSDSGGSARSAKRRKRRNGYQLPAPEAVNDLAMLTEEVLDSAFWLTPEPALQSKPPTNRGSGQSISDEPLKAILNIDSSNLPPTGWNFHVNAGAWRRILQNLTTNAIKYTDRGGHFVVGLSLSSTVSADGSPLYMVHLGCADSGRGMSREFLENGLWQEFQQEENNVQGTGLGLSLVKSLVEEMGGSIHVESTKGIGTKIEMSVQLTPGPPSSEESSEIGEAWRLKGLTFGLAGLDFVPDDQDRVDLAVNEIRFSLIKSCESLGLTHDKTWPDHASNADLYIITEAKAKSNIDIDELRGPSNFQRKPCMTICSSASSARALTSVETGWLSQAVIVSQPLGPRKLLRALISCVNKSPVVAAVGTSSTALAKVARKPSLTAQEQQIVDTLPPILSPLSTLPRGPVLLVDDNPVNLSLLQKSMQKLGRPQVSATNGLEAVEAYQNSLAKLSQQASAARLGPDTTTAPTSPVTVIFMDITMPVMDGLESTRRIRAYEKALKLRPAKIAALTALASPQAKEEAFGSGIDLFLTKPVRFKEIQGILEEWDRNFSG